MGRERQRSIQPGWRAPGRLYLPTRPPARVRVRVMVRVMMVMVVVRVMVMIGGAQRGTAQRGTAQRSTEHALPAAGVGGHRSLIVHITRQPATEHSALTAQAVGSAAEPGCRRRRPP
jgi:6-phosphogluconolactonase/glucosamine-6-phosphate isomerase/deaminase